jgi:hypothetical protein
MWRAATARTAFKSARGSWLAAHGFDPLDLHSIPAPLRVDFWAWSFRYLADRDPAYLAGWLARRGLPTDWTPTRVMRYDYGPPRQRQLITEPTMPPLVQNEATTQETP